MKGHWTHNAHASDSFQGNATTVEAPEAGQVEDVVKLPVLKAPLQVSFF